MSESIKKYREENSLLTGGITFCSTKQVGGQGLKNKVLKKLLALSLAAGMAVAAIGCGSSETTAEGSAPAEAVSEEASAEGVTEKTASGKLDLVTIYPSDGSTASGVVTGYKADILAKRGLQAEVWAWSEEKTNAILASGDLPDIMFVNGEKLNTLIEAGLVLNLDDYLTEEKLPHVLGDSPLMTAINYSREYRSAGEGVLYGIPTQVGVFELPKDNGLWADTGRDAVKVNWDVYYAAGCPEINSVDDLIPVMKKMMEIKPEADDGTKTWGTILNAGSDATYWGNIQLWNKWFGYESDNLPYLIESDMVNGVYSSILETGKDSLYYKGLKWYNECYREGVMDPDSINNDRETQKAKVEKSLACMIPSGTAAGWAGYLPVYIKGQQLYPEKWLQSYGIDNYLVVSAKCKNLEAALRAVDMLADPDTYFEIYCGPEGIQWEYDEEGLVMPTEYGLDCAINGTDVEINGEKIVLWLDKDRITSDKYAASYFGPDGAREYKGISEWYEVKAVNNDNEDYVQWRETFGYDRFYDQVVDNNAFYAESPLDNVVNFCPQPEDTMQLTIDAIKECVVEASWKMVYSDSEDAFDKIWDQMIQDCIELDGEASVQWRMDELNKAMEIKDALSAE